MHSRVCLLCRIACWFEIVIQAAFERIGQPLRVVCLLSATLAVRPLGPEVHAAGADAGIGRPAATTGQPSNSSVIQDHMFVSQHDGSDQHYVTIAPGSMAEGQIVDVLFALHGHGSDRWQYVRLERGECQATRDVAAQRGLLMVSPDYRASTSWMGPAATADLRQIIDELHARYRVRRIVISGASMGGASSLAFATMHPELTDGVVSLNGTANLLEYKQFADAIAQSYGGSRSEVPETYRVRSAELHPERLSMPVAMTSGGQDTVVPPDSILRLEESLRTSDSSVRLIHKPEGGHSTSYEDTAAALTFVLDQAGITSDSLTRSEPIISLLPADRASVVVCLGDSVTGVYYHTGGWRAYPEMLQVALKQATERDDVRVVNAGISGQTTADGLARLDRDVLSHQPDVVTISFGLNDMTRIDLEQFRRNLIELVQRCRASGRTQVVLCTPNAVLDTSGRPVERLRQYCQVIREVAEKHATSLCDQFQSGEQLRTRAPWTWRMTLSDEIHPNMDGHKRMAEELCRTITGQSVSLAAAGPPEPALPLTRQRLKNGMPLRVLVMDPWGTPFVNALRQSRPEASLEIIAWDTDSLSLAALEADAKQKVRSLKPDLVVLSFPEDLRSAAEGASTAAPGSSDQPIDQAERNQQQLPYSEDFVHAVSWVMNWSLSFGTSEWDCIVIHPAVRSSSGPVFRHDLLRQLVHAQDLFLIDRKPDDQRTADRIIADWIDKSL